MKAFRIKPIHPKAKIHHHNFIFSKKKKKKKIKNSDFELFIYEKGVD